MVIVQGKVCNNGAMKFIEVPVLGKLPRIALGCDRFGREVDEKTALAQIECYLASGGNVLDTAHVYGQTEDNGPSTSEILIGTILDAVARTAALPATKGGLSPKKGTRLDKVSLKEDVEASLENLQTVPDLWFFHRDDPSRPVEELLEPVLEYRRKGCLLHLGASNWSTRRIEEANLYMKSIGEEGFVAAENQFSLAYTTREIWGEDNIEYIGSPRCSKDWFLDNAIPCFCYSPPGRGILQKINRGTKELGKASRFLCDENIQRARRLQEVSLETGIDETALILSYITSQKAPLVALIGSYNVENIVSSLKAADLELDEELLSRLEEV